MTEPRSSDRHVVALRARGRLPDVSPPPVEPDGVAVLHGSTFILSDSNGNVVDGSMMGLFQRDTRTISTFVLSIDGALPRLLSSAQPHMGEARFFLQNDQGGQLAPGAVSIWRRRFLWHGLHEDITLTSHLDEPARFPLSLRIAGDFADLFEVKDRRPHTTGQVETERSPTTLQLRYRHQTFSIETDVTFSRPGRWEEDTTVFDVELPPLGTWELCLDVSWPTDGAKSLHQRHSRRAEPEIELDRWRQRFPRIRADHDAVTRTVERSALDLAALRVHAKAAGMSAIVPAAGIPWFMTVFGRDSIITALQTLPMVPEIARDVLRFLAAMQGSTHDDFLDEEPGKIMHEVRWGELTELGLSPHRPSYGSIDATPLWLILLSAYWHATGDDELVRELWPNARGALTWVRDKTSDGNDPFVWYATRSPVGLDNQGWKDSSDAIRSRDGAFAVPPIAVCEVQGYVDDALRRTAELAEVLNDDPGLAEGLRAEADRLREAFHPRFWLEDRGTYALAIDGEGRAIDSLTSNPGHLLWSGIAHDDAAAGTIDVLLDDGLWSGFGIRTMGAGERAYHPTAYHRGTVWPHDNSIIAAGFRRYGRPDAAATVAVGLFEAAAMLDYRLPETFAGYSRADTGYPVRYPSTSSPQAWAAAAPFLLLGTVLGLRIERGEPSIDPHVPRTFGTLEIEGLHAGGRRWTVRAAGTDGTIEPADR